MKKLEQKFEVSNVQVKATGSNRMNSESNKVSNSVLQCMVRGIAPPIRCALAVLPVACNELAELNRSTELAGDRSMNDSTPQMFETQLNIAETWLPAVGTEAKYQVSSYGRVRRTKTGRILRPSTDPSGYLCFHLRVNGKSICVKGHILVAKAFLGEMPDYEVNHLNGVRNDNRVSNLEYVTHLENMRHAAFYGAHRQNTGDYAIRSIVLLLQTNRFSYKTIADRTGTSVGVVKRIKKQLPDWLNVLSMESTS